MPFVQSQSSQITLKKVHKDRLRPVQTWVPVSQVDKPGIRIDDVDWLNALTRSQSCLSWDVRHEVGHNYLGQSQSTEISHHVEKVVICRGIRHPSVVFNCETMNGY